MFTGIVQTTGVLKARTARGPGARLSLITRVGAGPLAGNHGAGPLAALQVGESVAVHGVCLTVQTITPEGFECDASAETLARSTLGTLPAGSRVHLERALTLADRLGGHLVSGHIDGKVTLRSKDPVGDARKLVFDIQDPELARYVAPKGSVAIDGVSLTVNGAEGSQFDVVIIPHTAAVTTLGDLVPSQEANLEVDLVARYVARLLAAGAEPPPSRDDVLRAKLSGAGFL